MCDGQPADNCAFMKLTEFETAFNDRLSKLNEQFLTISDVLQAKKEVFIQMYRKDPRISHDDAVSYLQAVNESFDPTNPPKRPERNAMPEQLLQQLKITADLETTSLDKKSIIIIPVGRFAHPIKTMLSVKRKSKISDIITALEKYKKVKRNGQDGKK